VAAFDLKFDRRTIFEFPSCWDTLGNLFTWDQYQQLLVEAKRKEYSSHNKIGILKGKTIVNFLRRDF